MTITRLERHGDGERAVRASLAALLQSSPIPPAELIENLGLYAPRQALSRLLFFHELYRRIIDVHGVILDFGTRYGQTLNLWQAFRGIYEPVNYSRRIYGFDTFDGIAGSGARDGAAVEASDGSYGVPPDYDAHLSEVIDCQRRLNPLPDVQICEIYKGDARQTLADHLTAHPETLVSLAYFDMDAYAPTRDCLEMILDRSPAGAVLGFDELCDPVFPGETAAFLDMLGERRLKLRRVPYVPGPAFVVIE